MEKDIERNNKDEVEDMDVGRGSSADYYQPCDTGTAVLKSTCFRSSISRVLTFKFPFNISSIRTFTVLGCRGMERKMRSIRYACR